MNSLQRHKKVTSGIQHLQQQTNQHTPGQDAYFTEKLVALVSTVTFLGTSSARHSGLFNFTDLDFCSFQLNWKLYMKILAYYILKMALKTLPHFFTKKIASMLSSKVTFLRPPFHSMVEEHKGQSMALISLLPNRLAEVARISHRKPYKELPAQIPWAGKSRCCFDSQLDEKHRRQNSHCRIQHRQAISQSAVKCE